MTRGLRCLLFALYYDCVDHKISQMENVTEAQATELLTLLGMLKKRKR